MPIGSVSTTQEAKKRTTFWKRFETAVRKVGLKTSHRIATTIAPRMAA